MGPTLPQSSDELHTLLRHQFPGAIVDKIDGAYVVLTVHGTGNSEREAIENTLTSYKNMREDGGNLQTMIDDIQADLAEPGMSRERHDSLQALLNVASAALNAGILTNTVPWIMVPSYTRQIEVLRRRVSTRLALVAQEMKDREAAKHRASQKFTREHKDDAVVRPRPDVSGMSLYERLVAGV